MKHYPHHIGDFNNATRISKLPMVYVLTTPRFEFIKVGRSSAFKTRLSNIQAGCPFDLRLWCSIRTPRALEIEAFLHQNLSHCHVRGEWFKPSAADLDGLIEFCSLTNANVKEAVSALLQA